MEHLEQGILILDFGSQTTLLIARRIREMGVYTEVWSCFDPRAQAPLPTCRGIILSGGPASVGAMDAPTLAQGVLAQGAPLLGICYGMQLLVEAFGGQLVQGEVREYGRTSVRCVEGAGDPLIGPMGEGFQAWMSHGDATREAPEGWIATAWSAGGALAAARAVDRPVFGVQFHPEVSHTERGDALLRGFVFEVCGASPTWQMGELADELIEVIRAEVGPEGRVICGLSGGVDSTVAAALISRAIGRRLVCILVDTGLMRAGEIEQVCALFEASLDVELRVVDASALFLGELAGVVDPEQKRKIIGRLFIDVFEEAAKELEGVTHLAQGTLYPDVIESTSFRGPSSVIKSHHNVGGLPERLPFKLLEPLRSLFKDEVRALGRALGIPESLVGRHPFPGPGLAIRVLGEVTPERVAILREADRVYIAMLRELGLYDTIWQAFAVLLPVWTVGVMGDARTYEQVVALRAVTSLDGMTADRSLIPVETLALIADRITNTVRGVNRVVYDLTSKPPATIEWE